MILIRNIIQQCRFSKAITLFQSGFLKKWGLIDYWDKNLPCIFVGMYNNEDIMAVKRHTGFKIILFTGRDLHNASAFEDDINIPFVSDMLFYKEKLQQLTKRDFSKFIAIPIKDYSDFKSCPLGDKIYVYMGSNNEDTKQYLQPDKIDVLIKYFGREKFIIGNLGHTIQEVRDNYYKNSFINLQIVPAAGFTTMIEMGFMGRRSLTQLSDIPFGLKYKTMDDVIRLIKKEKKLIGSTNQEVSDAATKYLECSGEWKNINYWK